MLLAGIRETVDDSRRRGPERSLGSEELQQTMNYHDTLIESRRRLSGYRGSGATRTRCQEDEGSS
jgi:hypothetical protein